MVLVIGVLKYITKKSKGEYKTNLCKTILFNIF